MSINTKTSFEIPLDKTLCKQCENCEDFVYIREMKNGKFCSFLYCNGNKKQIRISNWRTMSDGYIGSTSKINGKYKLFHTLFKKDHDNVIDHIFGKRNDNRLRKLREITSFCNCQNINSERTSIFPGVDFHKRVKRFQARIMINGKRINLGYYNDEIEAFHNYVLKCEEIGRTVNKFTEAYKRYEHWLNMQSILQTIREDSENNVEEVY